MDILISGGTFKEGGVETILMNIIRNVDKEKIKFDIVAIRSENEIGRYDMELESYGVNIIKVLPVRKQGIWSYMKQLNQIMQVKHYDAIHINAVYGGIILLICAYLNKIKKRIYHSHNTHDKIFDKKIIKFIKPVLKFIINKLSNVKIACGKEAALYVFGEKYVNEDKVTILYNSVDLCKYCILDRNTFQKEREKIQIEKDYIVIGNAARFTDVKNQIYLIKIVEKINELNCHENQRFVLRLAGNGEQLKTCKKYVVEHNLETCIQFLGSIENMKEFYSSLDVFALPSLYEGFPVSAIEAQLCGIPTLMSDSITREADLGLGIVDFISLNEEEKWIKDIQRFASKRLFETNEKYEQVKTRFSLETLIEKINSIYYEL